ncbi:MAG TPA: catalase [Rhodanobacteraceae bacterium]|nr:catalase [Rhodanobacteraceae bacterium]
MAMAKRKQRTTSKRSPGDRRGSGDELHQALRSGGQALTTNQGVRVSDNQNSLRAHVRGPTLLEDFVLREKITHFDHERIPERIVHARGSAAHGFFELTHSLKRYTRAPILTETGVRTPVFTRFSTVAGGAGSVDTPRDVRGFAVKFYTREGNWDLVGNNIPVFFIQDAIKFPDLVHAVKMEPDRGFPQAASAHDTFWDFIGLTPESMHMILWAMSDRTIPRSLRMIEGFGIHSFRLINDKGQSTFVKFHWRPKLGLQSTLWNEAVKLAGADPDFHRRDLFEAITSGKPPEWEFAVQLFTEEQADQFPFDHLDATKLIPEEMVPLKVIGRMVLDRWPDNFFAETEQVAYCPANIVPGIDFSNDPLLQGRLFSYLDTQLTRLGSPNFHQLPINAPKCPFANNQRDGKMQHQMPKGRVNYEPSSLEPARNEAGASGFASFHANESGERGRVRSETFADHYSQARLFFRSQTPAEQGHIVSAFVFELSKVGTPPVRERIVGHLRHVDGELAQRVADGLGIDLPEAPAAAVKAIDMQPSPALGIIAKSLPTLHGRVIGILLGEGSDSALVTKIRKLAENEGASVKLVAEKIAGVEGQLAGTPSLVFDAVAILIGKDDALRTNADAQDFARDAFGHLKAILVDEAGLAFLQANGIAPDEGVTQDPRAFIEKAKTRFWKREETVRPAPKHRRPLRAR